MTKRRAIIALSAAALVAASLMPAAAQQSKPGGDGKATDQGKRVDDLLAHPKATLPECLDCTENLKVWRNKGCTAGNCSAECREIVSLMSDCAASCSTRTPQC